MNGRQFAESYVEVMTRMKPEDIVVVIDPKTGIEHKVNGVHYVPGAMSKDGQSRLIIELE